MRVTARFGFPFVFSVFLVCVSEKSGPMRSFTLSALAVGCLLQDSHAAVQLSFSKQKSEGRGRVSASAPRSDSANLDSAFSYQGATYVVNVTVGTPGQPVSLQLSTTASNTFVIDARSEWCAYDQYATTSDSSDSYDYLYCPWGTCEFVRRGLSARPRERTWRAEKSTGYTDHQHQLRTMSLLRSNA